jgi:general secretion pathway protein D
MHLDLEISQVLDRINVGGVSEPEIADNKYTSDIQLREGEVSLIGGIIQDTSTKSISGIPGLAHLPLIGRLFSTDDTEKNKTELVIALVPHIVRGPDITASNLKGVSSGSSTQVKVSYDTSKFPYDGATAEPAATRPGDAGSPAPATAPAGVTAPFVGAPPMTAPPMTAPPMTTPPVTAPPMTAPPMTAPPVTAPPVTAPSARAPRMAAPVPQVIPPGGATR